jgi:hypothetical protein
MMKSGEWWSARSGAQYYFQIRRFFSEFRDLSSVSYSDVLKYVRLPMNGVEPDYTQTSKDAGEATYTDPVRVLEGHFCQ